MFACNRSRLQHALASRCTHCKDHLAFVSAAIVVEGHVLVKNRRTTAQRKTSSRGFELRRSFFARAMHRRRYFASPQTASTTAAVSGIPDRRHMCCR
jgi:hypothetical protein